MSESTLDFEQAGQSFGIWFAREIAFLEVGINKKNNSFLSNQKKF